MKWKNDPLEYDKLLVLDAIIKLSEEFQGMSFDSISINDISSFIDKFFEKKNDL